MMRPLRVHETHLKTGISRTKEFEKKKLATHAVNVGVKCGHGCLYCSTGTMLRMHHSFKEAGESPFETGYAIVDPRSPERVAEHARRIRDRGMVQLCTVVDAWAPEAKQHNLGRRCLEAILSEPGWTVRVLTKNAAVREDFGLLRRYRDRVLVGLSITAPLHGDDVISILEPNASSIEQRMLALVEASALGLRTYAMLCPLLPGIADDPQDLDRMIRFAADCGVEEIFVEPVNPRGPGLRLCQEWLELWGYHAEATAISRIRRRQGWSSYVAELVANVQQSVRQFSDIRKLRFLLYPWRLLPEHEAQIRQDDAGVIWLENGREARRIKSQHNGEKSPCARGGDALPWTGS